MGVFFWVDLSRFLIVIQFCFVLLLFFSMLANLFSDLIDFWSSWRPAAVALDLVLNFFLLVHWREIDHLSSSDCLCHCHGITVVIVVFSRSDEEHWNGCKTTRQSCVSNIVFHVVFAAQVVCFVVFPASSIDRFADAWPMMWNVRNRCFKIRDWAEKL